MVFLHKKLKGMSGETRMGLAVIALLMMAIIGTAFVQADLMETPRRDAGSPEKPCYIEDNMMRCGGIGVKPYYDNITEMSISDFDWAIKNETYCEEYEIDSKTLKEVCISEKEKETSTFWIVPKSMSSLPEFHWFVTDLETRNCVRINQYYKNCKISRIDFSDFEEKNNISGYLSKEIIKMEDGYMVSYSCFKGSDCIIDLDPNLTVTHDSSTDIIGFQTNQTVGSNLGVRSDASILYMNFNINHTVDNALKYVQDNSIYNNYGNASHNVTWNSTGVTDYSASPAGGGYYTFDGVDDWIDIGSNWNYAEHSVSLWFKTNGSVSDYRTVFGIGDGSDDIRWNLNLETSGKADIFNDIDGDNTHSTSTDDFDDSNWHHIVAVTDSTAQYLYVDGILKDSDSISHQWDDLNNRAAKIGRQAAAQAYWNGSIDQVQIWDRALSAQEVSDLYNSTIGNFSGKYSKQGDFKSLVFYNASSSYWNTSFSIAETPSGRTGVTSDYGINKSYDNLVSYWSLDEYNGTGYVPDLSEHNDNYGTPTGTNNATGISSGAMRFDGVDDYISSTVSSISGSDTFSMSTWVNFNQIKSAQSNPVFGFGSVANTRNDFYVYAAASTGLWQIITYADNQNGVNSASAGEWYHLVAIHDSRNAKLYVNGVEEISYTLSGDLNINSNFYIGKSGYEARFCDGSTDEVMVYNKSLSADEIMEIYKAGLSQHANANITLETRTATAYNTSDTSLEAFWSFNYEDGRDEMNRYNSTSGGADAVTYSEENGTVGKGAYFDGNARLDLAANPAFETNNEGTIATWFQRTGKFADLTYLFGYADSVSSTDYILSVGFNSNDKLIIFVQRSGGNYATCISAGAVTDTNWHHVAYMSNSSNYKIYLDGEDTSCAEVKQGIGLLGDWFSDVQFGENPDIGTWRNSVTDDYMGSMDDFRIYNRSLTAAEVQDLYELGLTHIEWNNWNSEGKISDQTNDTATNQGNFFQFKTVFDTNNTNVSAYILNQSVGPTITPPPDVTPPSLDFTSPSFDNGTMSNYTYLYLNVTGNEDLASAVMNVTYDNGSTANITMTTSGSYAYYNITYAPSGWVYMFPQGSDASNNFNGTGEPRNLSVFYGEYSDPTLGNGTTTGNQYIYVNVTTNASTSWNLESCTLNWTYSNFTSENLTMNLVSNDCYLNVSPINYNESFYMQAYLKRYSDWDITEDRNITTNIQVADTTVPMVDFNSSTPANNSVSQNEDWLYAAGYTNESFSVCYLEENFTRTPAWTNNTMTQDPGNSSQFYLNFTSVPNGTTIWYRVHCNDTSNNWNTSEDRLYTINLTTTDTCSPVTGTAHVFDITDNCTLSNGNIGLLGLSFICTGDSGIITFDNYNVSARYLNMTEIESKPYCVIYVTGGNDGFIYIGE